MSGKDPEANIQIKPHDVITVENKAPDLQLQPDDILYIPNSLGKVIGARGAEATISLGTGVLVWR